MAGSLEGVLDWALQLPILASLVLCAALIPLEKNGGRLWMTECLGTIAMIALTFSPGKWFGVAGSILPPPPGWPSSLVPFDWVLHWFGVVIADYSFGGPMVNPGVAMTMYSLDKIDYATFLIVIAGQLAGGVIGFPLLQWLARQLGWTPLGGPQIPPSYAGPQLWKAAEHEFMAMLFLCFLVFAVNWEPSYTQKAHRHFYWVKQSLTAFGIRLLIIYLGAAGPAINPMLASCWVVSETGAWPDFANHYVVYWAAPWAAAIAAGLMYAMYKGESQTFFGKSVQGWLRGDKLKIQ